MEMPVIGDPVDVIYIFDSVGGSYNHFRRVREKTVGEILRFVFNL